MDYMVRDNDRRDEDASPIEHAIAELVRVVLTVDQHALLTAFDAITNPKVRGSLIEIARAAGGFSDERTPEHTPDPDGDKTHHPRPKPEIDGEVSLRRIRRQLRPRR